MTVCAACGAENREAARFCDLCGAALQESPAGREQRKTVSVLFCDVTGSTALGERLDPESLRHVLARYFEAARQVVERHGGSVEKFIGDAVMAVFGVPVVHEDDALRAVRAAAEIRDALETLNVELERDFGTTLSVRIGVTTGEVVTGTAERLATGDAVNVAARLEQAAEAAEILLGEETVRLLRDAVEVEAVEPLTLKGKRDAVPAYRLVAVDAAWPRRRLDAAIVGRKRELRLLGDAWERVLIERSCHLFTVLGAAGVGKSRLALELLGSLSGARVLRGRCLPYGEGITYWPVVEVLKQLPEPDATVLDARALSALRSLLGADEVSVSTDEIAWAVRKALEAAATIEPVVCVFDDVHWGEQTFLDLVEHIADLSRDAPILLLCMARPELLDRRSGWAGGKLNATTVLLEPLTAAETDALIDGLLAGAQVDDALRERIRERAEGNPLFVEEMLGMLRDAGGDGEVDVPPTIQALLAARIDQLDPAERSVLERGSVEGRTFHVGAVQALAPDETGLPAHLTALVRKELVRPDRARIAGDDAFRFRHLLIRDAAYDSLPKATRAELHEAFADWLEEHGSYLVELDEILGYHLEQAYRCRVELGPPSPGDIRNGVRAGRKLGDAGRRALGRNDAAAAVHMLARAVALPTDGPIDVHLHLALAEAIFSQGRPSDGVEVARAAAVEAREAGDRIGALAAELEAARLACNVDSSISAESLLALVDAARPELEASADDAALAIAAMAELWAWNALCQHARVADAATRLMTFSRRAGNRRQETTGRTWLMLSEHFGPTPISDVLRRLEAEPELDLLIPYHATVRGFALAMLGRLDEARAIATDEPRRFADFGERVGAALATANLGIVERLAGDWAASAAALQEACRNLESMGEQGFLSTYVGYLGQALYELDRLDEAGDCAVRGEELGAVDDIATQMLWRQLRGKVLARRGEHGEALRLAREAVRLGEPTDALGHRADSLCDLAEVLELAGRPDEAAAVLGQALTLYEQKGNLVLAERSRERLAGLGSGAA